MSVRVDLDGDAALLRVLASGGQAAARLVPKTLHAEASEAFADSQEQVPVRYGVLKSSGWVSAPTSTADGVEVTIGYGGAARAYALVVHETHPTRAKYLEGPVLRRADGLAERIAAEVASALRRLA
ncbi:MAG: hypothetical protein ACOYY2_13090 [Actinomycetota bacterium]